MNAAYNLFSVETDWKHGKMFDVISKFLDIHHASSY